MSFFSRDTMDLLELKLEELSNFLNDHKSIFEICMVDFITEDFFANKLNVKLQEQLLELDENQLIHLANLETNDELGHLLKAIKSKGLENSGISMSREDLQVFFAKKKVIPPKASLAHFDRIMSPKKQHEVQMMSDLVLNLAAMKETTNLLDLGSGKSYLGQIIAAMDDRIRIVAVDAKEDNTRAAEKRIANLQSKWAGLSRRALHRVSTDKPAVQRGKHWRAKMRRKGGENDGKKIENDSKNEEENENNEELEGTVSEFDKRVINVTRMVTSDTKAEELKALFITNDQKHSIKQESNKNEFVAKNNDNFDTESFKFGIIGLHTCGDLALQSLDTFLALKEANLIVNVGCCYHLMDENESSFPRSSVLRKKGFRLGRKSRMMAAQPPQRTMEQGQLPSESLLFRAVLQALLKRHLSDFGTREMHVGRIYSKSKQNFVKYFNLASKNLNLQLNLEEDYLTRTFDHLKSQFWPKLIAFYQLRTLFAPLVEAALVLDRFLYLLEQSDETICAALVVLFDPVISPRCHAIVAFRNCI